MYRYNAQLLHDIANPRSIEIPDPRERQLKDLNLQNAQQTSQMNGLKLQEAQQGQQVEAKLIEILGRHQGDIQAAWPEIAQSGARPEQLQVFKSIIDKQLTGQREEDIENFKIAGSTAAPRVPVTTAEQTNMPIGSNLDNALETRTPPATPGQEQIIDPPLQSMQIRSGITGGQSMQVQPQRPANPREAVMAAEAKARQELQDRITLTRETQKAEKDYSTVAPPKQTLEELTAFQWMKDNPGKTLNDYQNMDATRKKPVMNFNLEALRKLEIDARTTSTPGQLIIKATGNPVPSNAANDTASQRISGMNTALQQADVVKGLLDKIGSTGAIKGYVLREGIYWPVVQNNITPEQVEAVSEVQRMLNSYLYAVSGKAISEPEMQRVAKTAPDLRFTPEANTKILTHFKRYVTTERDNYLKVRGWAIKDGEAATPAPGGGSGRPRASDGQGNFLEFDGKAWVPAK